MLRVDNSWNFNTLSVPRIERTANGLSTIQSDADNNKNLNVVSTSEGVEIGNGCAKGSYKTDLNILLVHNEILLSFDRDKLELPDILRERDALMDKISNKSSLTVGEYKKVQKKLGLINKEIEELSGNDRRTKYLADSAWFINRYKELRPKKTIVNFSKPRKVEINEEKHRIIRLYMILASEYIDVDVVRYMDSKDVCNHCGTELSDVVPSVDGSFTCPECFAEIEYTTKTPVLSDSKITSSTQQNNYEDEANFEKALNRYQGKQSACLPPDFTERLDEYFSLLGSDIGKEIKKREFAKDGRRKKGTARDMMIDALSSCGMTDNYKDTNLICHLYWGWKLPDVSALEEVIKSDYKKVRATFLEIKGDTRKSCLGTQYVLFRLLQRRNHDCSFSDFKIVTTTGIFEYYQDSWSKICCVLGWTVHPLY